MSEVNSAPSSESLLERGYFFLKESEFKTSTLYFNRVLDIAPKTAAAYWGLLLSEYQCKESKELYLRLAVPINNSNNFKYAIENANEEQRNEYNRIAKLVLLACHKKVLKNALDGNDFLAKKWASHYSEAKAENKLFQKENQFIRKSGKDSPSFLKFLLSLYAKYDGLENLGEENIVISLKETVKAEYSARMEALLNKIKKNGATCLYEDLLTWANPLAAEYEAEKTADIGLDGHPSSSGDRFIFLAEEMYKTVGVSVEKYAKIDYCYEMALKCEPKEEYSAKRAAFYEAAVMCDGATPSEIDFIISLSPNIAKYHWKYVLAYTKNLSERLTSYIKDSEYNSFMKKAKEQYDEGDVDKLLGKQRKGEADLKTEYDALMKAISPYAEKALELSSLEEKEVYSRDWENFKKELSADKDENLKALEERTNKINEKVKNDNKQGSTAVNKKGVLLSLLSLLVLALAIPIYLFVDYTFNSLTELLKYPLIYVYLIALAATVVISLIQIKATKKICKYKTVKYKIPIYYKAVMKTARVLSWVILPVAVGFLVYSYIRYPENLGTVSISSVEDLQLIKNAPAAVFSLEADLDFTDKEYNSIGSFRGEILGNGHSISNLNLPENGFIKTNRGAISDLNIVSPTSDVDFNFIVNNNGKLKNIVLSDIVLESENDFSGIADTNKGKIVSCSVNKISGECNDFVGVCNSNKGEIMATTVSEVNIKTKSGDGFASVNSGTIIGCSFSGNLDAKGTVNGFISSINGAKATVERCFASGTVKGGQTVSGFIGRINEGILKDSYSLVNTTQLCCEYNDSIGGLVREISPSDGTDIEIKNCYFGGKITILPGEDSEEYEIVGGLIGVCDSRSGSPSYSILVDSCFNVGTYNLSAVYKGFGWTAKKGQITLNNTYGFWENDIGGAKLDGELKIMQRNNMFAAKFITETLGWDTEIWNVKQGYYPTLKEYVVVEAEESQEDTSSLVEEA